MEVIEKFPHPVSVKGVRSFLGQTKFYKRFINDFSKLERPMCKLLEKKVKLEFIVEPVKAFEELKRKLIEAPILIAPNSELPFELISEASDVIVGAVLR